MLEVDDDEENVVTTEEAPPMALRPIDPRLQKQLDVLIESTHVKMFIAAISDNTEQSASSIPIVANFLITLFSRWHAKKNSMLETLLLSGVSLSTALWNAVRQTRLWETLRAGRMQSSIVYGKVEEFMICIEAALSGPPDSNFSADWPLLTLLAELLSRQLQLVGDDEFFAGKLDIGVANIVELSGAINVSDLYFEVASYLGCTKPTRR